MFLSLSYFLTDHRRGRQRGPERRAGGPGGEGHQDRRQQAVRAGPGGRDGGRRHHPLHDDGRQV